MYTLNLTQYHQLYRKKKTISNDVRVLSTYFEKNVIAGNDCDSHPVMYFESCLKIHLIRCFNSATKIKLKIKTTYD